LHKGATIHSAFHMKWNMTNLYHHKLSVGGLGPGALVTSTDHNYGGAWLVWPIGVARVWPLWALARAVRPSAMAIICIGSKCFSSKKSSHTWGILTGLTDEFILCVLCLSQWRSALLIALRPYPAFHSQKYFVHSYLSANHLPTVRQWKMSKMVNERK
jgi:hypothetical protein